MLGHSPCAPTNFLAEQAGHVTSPAKKFMGARGLLPSMDLRETSNSAIELRSIG